MRLYYFFTSGDIAVQAVAKLNIRLGYSLFTHLSQSVVLEFEEMKMNSNSVFVADDVVLYSLKATSVKPAWNDISRDSFITSQPLAFALPRKSIALQKSANNAMKELLFTGDFERIYSKWFLARVPPDNALIHMSMPSQLKQDILKYNSEYPAPHAK